MAFSGLVKTRLEALAARINAVECADLIENAVSAARVLDEHVANETPSERRRVALILMIRNIDNRATLERIGQSLHHDCPELATIVLDVHDKIFQFQAAAVRTLEN